MALLFSKLIRFEGRWFKLNLIKQSAVAIALIVLSLIQVLVEDNFGTSFFTRHPVRFAFGCLAGLGLLQLVYLLNERPLGEKRVSAYFEILGFCVLFSGFYLISYYSYWISAIVSLLGLAVLYAVMNKMVLASFFDKLNAKVLWAIVPFCVMIEWTLLYYI